MILILVAPPTLTPHSVAVGRRWMALGMTYSSCPNMGISPNTSNLSKYGQFAKIWAFAWVWAFCPKMGIYPNIGICPNMGQGH